MAELIVADPIARLAWARQRARTDWLRDGRLIRYVQGRQGIPYTPDSATAEYRQLQRRCVTNVTKLAAEIMVAGLRVDGLVPSDLLIDGQPDTAVDAADVTAAAKLEETIAQAAGWRYWQAAKLDAGQTLATYRAVVLGYANVVTWATGEGEDLLVEARSVNPLASWGHYLDVDDEHPDVFIRRLGGYAGLANGSCDWEVWGHDDQGGYRAVVDERANTVTKLMRHDLDHVPVTRLVGSRDLEGNPEGRVAPLQAAQDRLNESVFALLVAQTYQSFRQRWAVGVKLDGLNPGADRVWETQASKEHAMFGEFQAADLNNLVAAVNSALSSVAALGQIPPQNVLGLPANVSADGLAAAEQGHTRQREEWQRGLGEGWETVVCDLGELAGDDEVAQDTSAQVSWAQTESRAFGAVVDGIVKLTQGERPILPVEVAIELVPGLTQQTRNRALRLLRTQPATGMTAMADQAAAAGLPDLAALGIAL